MSDKTPSSNSGDTSSDGGLSTRESAWDPTSHIASAEASSLLKSIGGDRSQVFVVTSIRGWIALGFFLLLIIALSIWVFAGQIVEVVQGDGMLIGRAKLYSVTSSASARVVQLNVTPGDSITRGDLLVELDPTELDAEIRGQRSVYDLQVEENARLTQSDIQELERVLDAVARSIQEQEAAIEISTQLIESYAKQMEYQKELLDRGLVTLQAYLKTKSEVLQLEENIFSAKAAIADSELASASARQSFDAAIASRLEAISKTDAQLGVLLARREQKNNIYSPVDGLVVAVDVEVQEYITSGEQMLRIEVGSSPEKPLHCLAYVPARMGKRIEQGMLCQLMPEVTYYNEYGYVLGRIQSVSSYPATRSDLMMQFGDSALVDRMVAQQPDGLLVDIELQLDPSTPTGYRWTSRKGFPEPLLPGTPTQVRVIYDRIAPIELISPLIKDYLFGRDPGRGPGSQ